MGKKAAQKTDQALTNDIVRKLAAGEKALLCLKDKVHPSSLLCIHRATMHAPPTMINQTSAMHKQCPT